MSSESVSQVFDKFQIQKSDYVVLAGFDESLVKSGVGYLEQIHVFTIAEVNPSSSKSLFTELGRLFSPFSSILFTETSSYRLPVYKYDGSEWEFDELVYLTASKFADDGSSAKTSPSLNTSLPDGFSQSEGGSGSGTSGEGEENKKSKDKEKEMGDKAEKNNNSEDSSDKPTGDSDDQPGDGDDEDSSNKPTDDDPPGDGDDGDSSNKRPTDDDPPGDGDGTPAASGQDSPREIKITVNSDIYHNQERCNLMGPSQTLTMLGSLTIEVFLNCYRFVLLDKIHL